MLRLLFSVKKDFSKRREKGFSLVEMLIVIAVIGILMMMVMINSDKATSSARATAILVELKSIKNAVLMYRNDNPDVTTVAEAEKAAVTAEIAEYLDDSDVLAAGGKYTLSFGTPWQVERSLSGENDDVKKAIKGRADKLKLWANSGKTKKYGEESLGNSVFMDL